MEEWEKEFDRLLTQLLHLYDDAKMADIKRDNHILLQTVNVYNNKIDDIKSFISKTRKEAIEEVIETIPDEDSKTKGLWTQEGMLLLKQSLKDKYLV